MLTETEKLVNKPKFQTKRLIFKLIESFNLIHKKELYKYNINKYLIILYIPMRVYDKII